MHSSLILERFYSWLLYWKGAEPHSTFRIGSAANKGNFNQVSAPLSRVLLENLMKTQLRYSSLLIEFASLAERVLDFV
jgi:hypothetical protein